MEYRTMDSFMFFMLANSCSVDRRPLIQNSIHLFSFISIHSFINSFNKFIQYHNIIEYVLVWLPQIKWYLPIPLYAPQEPSLASFLHYP